MEKVIKQLKIRQDFLDDIKNGYKDFEIRKELLKDGVYELIVYDKKYCECGSNWEDCCWKSTLQESNGAKRYEDECIKDRLKVRLKRNYEMNAFDIGIKIRWQIENFYDSYGDSASRVAYFLTGENNKNPYFKQSDSLYWYDLEVINDER